MYPSALLAWRPTTYAPRRAVRFPICFWCGEVFTSRTARVYAVESCYRVECQRRKDVQRQIRFQSKWKAKTGTDYKDRYAVEQRCVDCGSVDRTRRADRTRCGGCARRLNAQAAVAVTRKPRPLVGPVEPRRDEWHRRVAAKSRLDPGAHAVKPRVFVEGPCAWCDDRFSVVGAGSSQAKFCSDRCARAASKASRGRFSVPPGVRLAIYERDGWVCQLCDEPVDPELDPSDVWAATLDHIVPRSWTLIPDDSPENLRLAHRWCNSVRGDERYYDESVLKAG